MTKSLTEPVPSHQSMLKEIWIISQTQRTWVEYWHPCSWHWQVALRNKLLLSKSPLVFTCRGKQNRRTTRDGKYDSEWNWFDFTWLSVTETSWAKHREQKERRVNSPLWNMSPEVIPQNAVIHFLFLLKRLTHTWTFLNVIWGSEPFSAGWDGFWLPVNQSHINS